MNDPKCTPFPAAARFKQTDVQSIEYVPAIEYGGFKLEIKLSADGVREIRVVFHCPIGFRALDERDLCEFWKHYNEKNGWLYEVEQGGWMELERTRGFFNSHEVCTGLREYLLVDDMTINVLSQSPPEIFG